MTAHPWTVRAYRAGDETRIVELFNEVFAQPITVDRYCWKLLDGPRPQALGHANVWVAEVEDRIIGHYAGAPLRLRMAGADTWILHGCDVMTAADFRGRGVLTTLGEAAHRAWAERGIALVTGLHYGGWGSRRHHLGWREQFHAAWYWSPILPGARLQRAHVPALVARGTDAIARSARFFLLRTPRSAATGIEIADVAEPGRDFDDLWARVSPVCDALVVRDAAWLRYRFTNVPGCAYRILGAFRAGQLVGYLVYRLDGASGLTRVLIADALAHPRDHATHAALRAGALRAFFAAAAVDARALLPPSHPLARTLRRAGFIRRRHGFDVSIVPLARDLPREILRDPRRFVTTGGDYDVV